MDKQPQSRAPLIVAVVLLLLPVLYVGSYLALVVPCGIPINDPFGPRTHWRFGAAYAESLFWPLEQIDRKVRPGGVATGLE
jgi:hypothetical protein